MTFNEEYKNVMGKSLKITFNSGLGFYLEAESKCNI